MSENKNNRYNNIIKDLNSDNNDKIITAIKQLRKHGKADSIDHLIDVYYNTTNQNVKNDITQLLFDLKDESSVNSIISAIENKKYNSIKPFLISILWQAAIDSSAYISRIVRQALVGDYETCLEVLTVIESYDATFDEAEIEDLKFDIDDIIDEQDEEKQKLLLAIRSGLDELNIEY